jgi:hypothetical protein
MCLYPLYTTFLFLYIFIRIMFVQRMFTVR